MWICEWIMDKPLTEPTMFVGLDVSHDRRVSNCYGPVMNGRFSTVGVTASYDASFTQYHAFVSYQEKNYDRVMAIKEIMIQALEAFHVRNGCYPLNVFIYRDGVSNSQLDTFVRKELQDIEAAFRHFNIRVNLTCVVVQKRVTTRLFKICPKFGNTRAFCDHPKCEGEESHHSPAPGIVYLFVYFV